MTIRAELKADPEVLRKAEYAEFRMIPYSDAAKALEQALTDQTQGYLFASGIRKRKFKDDALTRFRSTVSAFVAELLVAALNEDAEGFCYRSSNRAGFSKTVAESRHYDALKSAWAGLELIEVVDGFRGSDDWDGDRYHPETSSFMWATRLRAKPSLLHLMYELGITRATIGQHYVIAQAQAVPIIVRSEKLQGDRNAKLLEPEDTAKLHQLRSDVNEINDFLATWDFNFGPAPYLHRIYNDGDLYDFDWNYGGRFYGPSYCYLNWPSELRAGITIGGSPVKQIDISSCQLTILYGLLGEPLDLSSDPYLIDDLPREEVKKTINLMIGLGRVPDDTWGKYDNTKLNSIKHRIIEKYPVLNQLVSSGLNSKRLQAFESDIICKAILALGRQHNVPSLPVHDCLIVRIEDVEQAKAELTEAFHSFVGLKPRLKVSS